MAQIDASIPLQAYTAADYQKQTANQMALEAGQMDLEQKRQSISQQKALRDAFTGADTTTPEGQKALLQKVGAIDPAYRLKLEKDFNESKKTDAQVKKYGAETTKAEAETKSKKLETALKHMEVLGREALAVKDKYQAARSAGKPEAEAVKIANDAYVMGLTNLFHEGVLNADQLRQMMSQPLDINQIDGAISQTMSVKDQLHQKLEAAKAAETQRHNKATEGIQGARVAIERENLSLRREEATGAKLTPEAEQQAAEIYLKTGTLPPNLGRGKQGAETIARIVNKSAELSRGKSSDDIVTERQETKATGRTRLELGAREGKIAPRVQEAKSFAEIALKASDTVDRSTFRSFNKFLQMGQGEIGDPKLRAFQAANTSLINAYAAAVSNGSPTVSDKTHARDLLATADNPAAYKAVVNQMITEMDAALAAPKKVMEEMRPAKPGAKEESKTVSWDSLK